MHFFTFQIEPIHLLDDLAHGEAARLEGGPAREDVDDPGLLLAGVPPALYHHPQALLFVLPYLHLHQVRRPHQAGPASGLVGRKVNIKTFLSVKCGVVRQEY